MRILAAGAAAAIGGCATISGPPADPPALVYRVTLDEATPLTAQLELDNPPMRLFPARDGTAAPIEGLSCDGRRLALSGVVEVPRGCATLRWTIRLVDLDAQGVDASIPPSGWSPEHRFWYLAERHGFLRPASLNRRGEVKVVIRWSSGSAAERVFGFPSLVEPPFYAVVGGVPAQLYQADGVRMSVWGSPPAYAWMADLHRHVLSAWARWRRDVVAPGASSPAELDFAWLKPPSDMEPGYSASAGAQAIGAQLRLREGDPDAELKARAVIGASAAHEGFHAINGTTGRGWPAWVNESLANHFALEAARAFLDPADFAFLEQVYSDAEVTTPLLAAQLDYDRGSQDEGRGVFYSRGARFWREIEAVLTSRGNASGRLAALIQDSGGLRGVDWTDADAVARWLDRHSGGRAGPIVRCHLSGTGCPR